MSENVCPACQTEWPSEAAAEGFEILGIDQCMTCGAIDEK